MNKSFIKYLIPRELTLGQQVYLKINYGPTNKLLKHVNANLLIKVK